MLVGAELDKVAFPDTVTIEAGVETVFNKTVDEALTLVVAILVTFESRLAEARDDIGTGITVIVVAPDVEFVVERPATDPEMIGTTVTDAAPNVEFDVEVPVVDSEMVGTAVTDATLAGIGNTVIV